VGIGATAARGGCQHLWDGLALAKKKLTLKFYEIALRLFAKILICVRHDETLRNSFNFDMFSVA